MPGGRGHGPDLPLQAHRHGHPAEEQAGLFEPFHRTQEAQVRAIPGSGPGLAVVRRVVSAHDGTIDLSSAPGVGTTVTLTVPTAESAAVADGSPTLGP